MRLAALISAFALLAPLARAEAPDRSPRPFARAELPVPQVRTLSPVRPKARPIIDTPDGEAEIDALAREIVLAGNRPQLRPQSEQELRATAPRPDTLAFFAPGSSRRPDLRPPEVIEFAMAQRRLRRQGAVCGDIDIQGEKVGRVPGERRGCGIKGAVRLKSVSGLRLSQQSLVNCDAAKALKRWIDKGVKPAFGRKDAVKGLRVAAHYACRTRNSRPGARISEHGKGNAIDISGFILESGRLVTVMEGWNGDAPLRRIHKSACGPFSTVLGPDSDRYHRDHFHLDVARHRGGAYCR